MQGWLAGGAAGGMRFAAVATWSCTLTDGTSAETLPTACAHNVARAPPGTRPLPALPMSSRSHAWPPCQANSLGAAVALGGPSSAVAMAVAATACACVGGHQAGTRAGHQADCSSCVVWQPVRKVVQSAPHRAAGGVKAPGAGGWETCRVLSGTWWGALDSRCVNACGSPEVQAPHEARHTVSRTFWPWYQYLGSQ